MRSPALTTVFEAVNEASGAVASPTLTVAVEVDVLPL